MYGDFRRRSPTGVARKPRAPSRCIPIRSRLGHACEIDRPYVTGIIDRSLQPRRRAAGSRPVPLVELCGAGRDRDRPELVELRRAGKIAQLAGTNFDTAQPRPARCRSPAHVDAGAVFAARRPPGKWPDRALRGARNAASLLRHARRRIPVGGLARPGRADRPHQPLAHQVQARSSTILAAGRCSRSCWGPYRRSHASTAYPLRRSRRGGFDPPASPP